MGNEKRRREYERLREERMEGRVDNAVDFVFNVFSTTLKIAKKGVILVYDGGREGVRKVKESRKENVEEIEELAQIISGFMSFFESDKRLNISCYSIIEQCLFRIEKKKLLLTYKEKENLLLQKKYFNSFSEKDINESNKEIIEDINHLFERTTASVRRKSMQNVKNLLKKLKESINCNYSSNLL